MRAVLKLKSQHWNGWSPEKIPATEKEYTLGVGDFISRKRGDLAFDASIEAVKIEPKSVTLRTNSLTLKKTDGSMVDSRDTRDALHTVGVGESLSFETQAMDVGCTYTVTVLTIEP